MTPHSSLARDRTAPSATSRRSPARRPALTVVSGDSSPRTPATTTVTEPHPFPDDILRMLFGDPVPSTAWTLDEPGDQILAQVLADIDGSTVRLLHDHASADETGRLPHLAVASSGVFVIETHQGATRRGGLRSVGATVSVRAGRLLVRGRDRTDLIESLQSRLAPVGAALGFLTDIPVRPILCLVDAGWPDTSQRCRVDGVEVVSPDALAGLLTEPGRLDELWIGFVQQQLDELLPYLSA